MRNISPQASFLHLLFDLILAAFLLGSLASAQQATNVVPTLVNFNGTVTDVNGKPLSGIVGVTFCLYKDQQGGSPLWIETQNVQADRYGHYTVALGASKSQGLPTGLFASGEARWLGVQAEGQTEQPRVMLLAVPYALKAGDAATVGGLPPSAFMLAVPGATNAPSNNDAGAGSNAGLTAAVGGSGTTDFVPLWTAGSVLGNSILFQSGSGSTAMIGLNESTPLANLDINGSELVRGLFESATKGTANASQGFNSNATDFEASSFNSGTSKAVLQHFEWQAEPTGNNTTNPSATLNLLFATGTNTPAETGLKLSNTGQFTFATGQTFPGTGTITGVTTATGSGLTGGGTSGNLNLGLTNTCSANQILQWSGSAWGCATISSGRTITGVTAGTDLTGGGTSGNVTLNLDTTKVPQLNVANTFTQPLTVTATVNTGFGTIAGNNASSSSNTSAVIGNATYTGTASTIGVQGYSQSSAGWGVYGIGGAAGVYGGSTVNGVFGNSTSGNGVYGQTAFADGTGVYGTNSAGGIGVAGEAPTGGIGVYGENRSSTAGGDGILGLAHTSEGNGVHGYNDAPFAVGVFGENSASNGYGVYGAEYGTNTEAFGLYGYSASSLGVGTYGQAVAASAQGAGWGGTGAYGVWGDYGTITTELPGAGVLATADNSYGLLAVNNSVYPTVWFQNDEFQYPDYDVMVTFGGNYGGQCFIDVSGNLSCTGTYASVVPAGGSRKVALNTISSPEHWFEDAGSGQLSNGEAVVNIEAVFGETVNTGMEYHVFLTPNGDCKGLYVAQKSPTSFVVRELGGGTSGIAFDYRIMAKRKGFEQLRLVDKTERMNAPPPKRAVGTRPAMPKPQDMRKAQEAHMKTAHLAQPVLNTK